MSEEKLRDGSRLRERLGRLAGFPVAGGVVFEVDLLHPSHCRISAFGSNSPGAGVVSIAAPVGAVFWGVAPVGAVLGFAAPVGAVLRFTVPVGAVRPGTCTGAFAIGSLV